MAGRAEAGAGGGERVAVVLAAGKGTRMCSRRAKVLHEVGGRSCLRWVLDGARACGCTKIFVVVGPDADDIRETVRPDGSDAEVHWVVQKERNGTGHAVQIAAAALEEHGVGRCTALVLYGDAPLVRHGTLERLLRAAEEGYGALSVATLERPGNLGRVRHREGQLETIVEVADATAEDLEVRCVNAGHYALPFPAFATHLERLEPANRQGELYLTDAVVAAAAEHPVRCVELEDPSEAWGVNTRADLARVHDAFCRRRIAEIQEAGVTVLRPDTVTVEATAQFEPDVVLHPGVSVLGTTRIGSGTVVHTGSWLKDTTVGEDCEVRPYSVLEGAVLARGCGVGPFVRLRPGSTLEESVHVGNFVEIKKSTLEEGVKAGHLTYLGDATVGAHTNIGAGVVTCNYDGRDKHRTHIGERAFVGSDTMLVAPVRVGGGATTAAGSVVTHDVPDGALAVGRSRQRNIEGWSQRRTARGETEDE